MSQPYNGIPGNVVPPSGFNITGVTNVPNPTITVSGVLPPSFVPGVEVTIYGVQGALVVNGTRAVATVTGPSTFTVATVAPGAYTTGGVVQPVYLEAATIPGDGDNENAASVNTALESHADQLAFLTVGAGAFKMPQAPGAYEYVPSPSSPASGIEVLNLTLSGVWVFAAAGAGYTYALIDRVNAGDQIEIECHTSAAVFNQNGQTGFLLALGYAEFQPGVAPGAFTPMANEATVIPNPGVASGPLAPVVVRANRTVTTTGAIQFTLGAAFLDGTGTPTVNLYRSLRFYWRIWRSTNAPQ